MLPSQNREGRDRRYMYHRGRPSRVMTLAVGGALLLGGGWWYARTKVKAPDPADLLTVANKALEVAQAPLGAPESAVDRMKELREGELAYDKLADQLTAEGSRTRKGTPWHGYGVQRILVRA